MDALEIHNAVFDYAKANGLKPKELFAELYNALIGKDRGPRMGKMLHAIGVAKVKEDLGL
jgi:lysyl-tRNA synthetase class 1